MHPMLNIGIRAAHAAGDHIIKYLDRAGDITVQEKTKNDFVTEIDRQAEVIIIDAIRKAYPKHAFLAEESGQTGESEFLWIIDPLDGTTNFLHGIPHFAVSIALQHRGELEQAIVYDPAKQELFTASKGNGAYLNNRRMRVSQRKSLEGALLGTGFPFGGNHHLESFIETYRTIFPMIAGIRRAGTASLDLAYVACGRLDGFWEFGLKPWDIAAGILLIQEAGGIVSNIDKTDDLLKTGNIIAANSKLLDELSDKVTTGN